MGSIPVAGAKKTDGFAVGLFGTRTRTHLCEQSEQKWVRILGAERVELARTAASRRIFAAGEIPIVQIYFYLYFLYSALLIFPAFSFIIIS
ncbi:MAG: hypothetical protein J6S71_07605 [Clostridia bacterium]|nr:hypothetical protein [Clostridia bacterium]